MRYLCLAYGAEKDWQSLPKDEQQSLLAKDAAIRACGAIMASVQPSVTSVRAWDGTPKTNPAAFAMSAAPLAGFSIIEAADVNEVVRLVADTPCARAKGVIEIREILKITEPGPTLESQTKVSNIDSNVRITNALASVAVNDQKQSVKWYERIFGRAPDLTLSSELAEWQFEQGGGLQVYQLKERAGNGSFTLAVSSLDDQIAALRKVGIDPGKPIINANTKAVMIKDPDGNSIAFAENLFDGG